MLSHSRAAHNMPPVRFSSLQATHNVTNFTNASTRREFETNANVAASRALMQQGLRHCPRDEGLWAEYLRLELLYVARLRARRAVLGLPNPGERHVCVCVGKLLLSHRTWGQGSHWSLLSSCVDP